MHSGLQVSQAARRVPAGGKNNGMKCVNYVCSEENCVFTRAYSVPSWDTGLPHCQHSHRHRRQRERHLGGRPAPPVHRLLEEGEAAQVGVREVHEA